MRRNGDVERAKFRCQFFDDIFRLIQALILAENGYSIFGIFDPILNIFGQKWPEIEKTSYLLSELMNLSLWY